MLMLTPLFAAGTEGQFNPKAVGSDNSKAFDTVCSTLLTYLLQRNYSTRRTQRQQRNFMKTTIAVGMNTMFGDHFRLTKEYPR